MIIRLEYRVTLKKKDKYIYIYIKFYLIFNNIYIFAEKLNKHGKYTYSIRSRRKHKENH